MKKLFALAALTLAACSPPQGQGFGQYSISDYLYGGSGQGFALNNLAIEDDGSVPGMGTIPAGYVPGLERIENGQLVTYAPNGITLQASDRVQSVTPLDGSAATRASVSAQGGVSTVRSSRATVMEAMRASARAPKQTIMINNARHSLAYVTIDGQSFAVVKNRAFLRGASRQRILAESSSFLPCAGAGGIWGGTGSYASTHVIQLTCRV